MFTDRMVVMKYWNRVEIGMHAYKNISNEQEEGKCPE